MKYIIVGLGNPGADYEGTRHNIGRMILEKLGQGLGVRDWVLDKKLNALIAKEKINQTVVELILPEGFMNNSGKSLKPLITSVKKAESLIVVHDDLDLPLGRLKITFNRGPGGHRGVESIIKNLKTEQFTRVKIGICPTTPSGKLKKPTGEKAVVDFILGKFKETEQKEIKKIIKKSAEALEVLVTEGREIAMGQYN